MFDESYRIKYPKRKLTWIHKFSWGNVNFITRTKSGCEKKRNLVVSIEQLNILWTFQTCNFRDIDLQSFSDIEAEELNLILKVTNFLRLYFTI